MEADTRPKTAAEREGRLDRAPRLVRLLSPREVSSMGVQAESVK
jgi:hypothetical protein